MDLIGKKVAEKKEEEEKKKEEPKEVKIEQILIPKIEIQKYLKDEWKYVDVVPPDEAIMERPIIEHPPS